MRPDQMPTGRFENDVTEEDYVYVLTEYVYDTFSYSGLSEERIHIHRTREGAENKAKALKLKVVEYPEYDDEATIEEILLEE